MVPDAIAKLNRNDRLLADGSDGDSVTDSSSSSSYTEGSSSDEETLPGLPDSYDGGDASDLHAKIALATRP